jgi:MATE family multidrug resistance protein
MLTESTNNSEIPEQNQTKSQLEYITETLKLSLPLVMSNLISMMITFVGVLMISKLGDTALAASALITSAQSTIFVICMGLLFSISVMVGHAYGAKNYFEIGSIVQQGYLLALLISIPVVLLVWNVGHILALFKEPPELINSVTNYFHAFCFGVPTMLCTICSIQFMMGYSKRLVIILMSLSNLILICSLGNAFIFGKFGLPTFGITGLGYAWAIQSWAVFTFFVFYLFISKNEFQACELFNLRIKQTLPILKKLLHIGWPICVQMGCELLVFFAVTIMAGWINVDALAARQISVQYTLLMILPLLAISQASGVLVSRAMGAKRPQDVKHYGNYAIILGVIISSLICLIFLLSPHRLTSLFVNTNIPENINIVKLSITLLIIAAISQVIDGVRNVLTGALRGLYDTQFPMKISFLSLWVIGLPLAYILAFPLHLGIVGLSLAFTVSVVVGAVILYFRWKRKVSELKFS